MTRILAIDPGNTESGWVVFDGTRVLEVGISPNDSLLWSVDKGDGIADVLAIEMMKARGMPMSNEAMETLVWVGRFKQAWPHPDEVELAYRHDIKMHICGSAKAKDANVNTALRDMLGKPGTKKKPGPTYGVTKHAWAALAVAVYVRDQMKDQHETSRTADRRPALRSRPRVRL